jgi:hypothetical protein
MTGIAALAAIITVTLIAVALHALRRRRRELVQRPLVLATPGGRAFAANVDSLSDFRMALELPRRK